MLRSSFLWERNRLFGYLEVANYDGASPIKVMYLLDTYKHPYAGTERQLFYLIEGLDKSKFQVSMTVLRSSQYLETNAFPCHTQTLGIKKLFSFSSIVNFIRFAYRLKKARFDLVHIYFNDAAIFAPIFLKLFRIKVIVSRRDMGFWYTPANLKLLRLNRFLIDAVVANAHAVKDVVNQQEYIPKPNIHVIYNGFDFDKVNKSQEVEVGNKLSKNGCFIGVVANIRPVKRMGDLINAFALVRKEFPNVDLLVIGEGDTGELSRLAKDLAVEKSVCFMGKQIDTVRFIKQLDVAVLCSESEGLSNSIIEYMACSVPVVCTNVGGNKELVTNGESGYLFEVGDVTSLAEKIKNILNDTAHANDIALNAENEIKNKCDMNMMLQAHSDLYHSLCRA